MKHHSMEEDKPVPEIKACPLIPKGCAYVVNETNPLFTCNKCLQALTCKYFTPSKLVPEDSAFKSKRYPDAKPVPMPSFGDFPKKDKIAVPSKFYLEEPSKQFTAEHDEWFLHYRIDKLIDCLTKIVERI